MANEINFTKTSAQVQEQTSAFTFSESAHLIIECVDQNNAKIRPFKVSFNRSTGRVEVTSAPVAIGSSFKIKITEVS